jgi:hypothetical protein
MERVREFLSKSIAGGLSAGVVLLWWPVLFDEVDTVTSWFVRGVAWTVCFELLLFALIPFERALWDTARAERIVQRVGSAGLRIDSGSHRRRIGRLSAVAGVALAVPVALLVAGLHAQLPVRAEAATPRPVKVVRVTKVIRPVTVQRVVQQAPQPEVTAPAPAPTRSTEAPAPKRQRTVVAQPEPVDHQPATAPPAESTPGSAP